MTGVGGASLDWDRRRRVTLVQTASQEAWPEAEPLGRNTPLGESRGGTPSDERALKRREPYRKVGWIRISVCRRSASPFPLCEGRHKQAASGGERGTISRSPRALRKTRNACGARTGALTLPCGGGFAWEPMVKRVLTSPLLCYAGAHAGGQPRCNRCTG